MLRGCIKGTASATNQIKHGGFSYIPVVSLMQLKINFKQLISLHCKNKIVKITILLVCSYSYMDLTN